MDSLDDHPSGYPPSHFPGGAPGYPPGLNPSDQTRPIGFVSSDAPQPTHTYTHTPATMPAAMPMPMPMPTTMDMPSPVVMPGSSVYPQPPAGGGPFPGLPLPGGPLPGGSLHGGPLPSRSRTSVDMTSAGYPAVGHPQQTPWPHQGVATSAFSPGHRLSESSEQSTHGSSRRSIAYDGSGVRTSRRDIHRDLAQRASFSFPGKGSIKPQENFDAQRDAEALRKALKGWCTNHNMIISVVCGRSCDQRLEITRAYKQRFGRDLVADLKHALRGNFKGVIVGLLYPLHEYLARELRKAIAGLGTDEQCLIEILCTHSNSDINLIKAHYQQLFKKDLEKDIIGDTSGDFRRLLVSMCNAHREEGVPLDEERARRDAQKLLEAGVLRWGTDVSIFNCIIAGQSYEQLRLVFREYNALANHTIMEAVTREMSGDIKRGFLAIIKCVYNTAFYFAEELYNAVKGVGTNNKVLKRVLVSRCEIDLEVIKQEYFSKYNIPLATAIQKDTSGSYRKALLAIVNGN